jgi:hypothetical protein
VSAAPAGPPEVRRRSWAEVRWRQFRHAPRPIVRAVLSSLIVAIVLGLGYLAYDVALSRGPSEKEVAELDVRFHDLIYQAARHQRLYDCWANLKAQIYIFLLSRNVVDPDAGY